MKCSGRVLLLLVTALLFSACGGNDSGVSTQNDSAKSFTDFSINGTPGQAVGNDIVVTMPSGTTVASLTPSFTAPGASVAVNGQSQTSGVTANNFTNPVTYTVTAADGSTANYAVSVTNASSSDKTFASFSLNGAPGTIYGENIFVTLPFGTPVNNLIASFAATGKNVTVAGNLQSNGATANDFTKPVTYTVTAADGSTINYIVSVSVAANSAKEIAAFSLNGETGIINGQNISVTLPYGTPLNSLVATFTSTGQSVAIGSQTQVSGKAVTDFTNPVTYTVTAADGSTTNYVVTAVVAPSNTKAITAFSLVSVPNGQPQCTTFTTPEAYTICSIAQAPYFKPVVGVITGNTITVTLPVIGSYPVKLAATFSTTGESVSVGNVVQISGQTENSFFVGPVTYVVTAADGSTATYTVKVVASDPLCDFSVSFGGLSTVTSCS